MKNHKTLLTNEQILSLIGKDFRKEYERFKFIQKIGSRDDSLNRFFYENHLTCHHEVDENGKFKLIIKCYK